MKPEDCLAEAHRLIEEASDYINKKMPEGAAWRCADALFWLKKSGVRNVAGIDKPTGLGSMLQIYGGKHEY